MIEYLNLQTINGDGSPETYGVHGDGFYPAKSIRLLNYHIAKTRSDAGTGFNCAMVLDDTSANSSEIIRSGVEERLIGARPDNADAGNAADACVLRSDNACGKSAKMILAGQPEMTAAW